MREPSPPWAALSSFTAITHFAGTTLVLGESELGVDWELGPSDRFARYAFNVKVDIPLSATERGQIRAIVDYLKPAHTHFVQLIEPMPPAFIDHWELGVSELGETSELHGAGWPDRAGQRQREGLHSYIEDRKRFP